MIKQQFLPNGLRATRPRSGFLAAAIVLSIFAATPSLAHKTFLWPSKFLWKASDVVEIAFTSALAFPDLQFGPALDRISIASVILDNDPISDLSYEESDSFLNVKFTVDRPGLAVVAMSTKPRFGEIKPEDTNDYLDEIGASASVRAAFEALPGTPPLNRSYAKHSKTFICIETCSTGAEAKLKPVDQSLEFVAVESENTAFMLLREGEPLAGHAVSVNTRDGAHHELSTNEAGIVRLGASITDVVMLMSIWITLPSQPDGVYHSDYATLTVDLAQPH